MRAISPFKNKTGVIAIFIALFVSASGSSASASLDEMLEEYLKKSKGSGLTLCQSLEKDIDTANKEFREACAASKVPKDVCNNPKTLPKCTEKKAELEDFLEGEDASSYEDCEKLKAFIEDGCTGFLPDTDEAGRVYKEYRRELKDLQRERDKAKKEADEKRKEMLDQLNKLDDDAFKEDKEWQETRRELNDEIQKEIAEVESEKTKAWADARKKADEIEVAYMDLQKKIRHLQTSIGVMNAQWGIQCRLAADAAAKQAEAEFEARLEAENKLVKNYSFSTAARKLKNELKKKRRKITNKYNEVYARCMRGEIAPGAEIRAKLTEMEVQVANETIDANNRVKRMERLQRESAESLQALLTSLENQKNQRVMSLQQAINELDRNHQVRSNQIAMQKMQLNAEMSNQMANANKEMGTIAEQIEDFRRESLGKSAIAKCNRILPGKEEKTEARKSFDKLEGLFDNLKSKCKSFENKRCEDEPIRKDDPNSPKLGFPVVCKDFLEAIERTSSGRSSVSSSTTSTRTTSTPRTSSPPSAGTDSDEPMIYADPKSPNDSTQ